MLNDEGLQHSMAGRRTWAAYPLSLSRDYIYCVLLLCMLNIDSETNPAAWPRLDRVVGLPLSPTRSAGSG